MNNIKIYRPYNSAANFGIFFAGIMVPIMVYFLFLAILDKVIWGIFAFGSASIASFGLLFDFVNKKCVRFLFDIDGIIIMKNKNYFMNWKEFSYAYFCVDDRNWPYLVLANKEVSKKQTIKMLKPTFLKEVMRDGTVCMRLATLKPEEREQIKQIVTENIPNIIEYKPKKWLFD